MQKEPVGTAQWLKTYYYLRAAVSVAWVAAALTIGRSMPMLAAVLLIAYPAWDAVANWIDARRSGGLMRNKTQALNFTASVIVTLSVAVALGQGMGAVLTVFGIWAILSGLFQLATGVRRWKAVGGQWAMVLSGAQSALAGTHFLIKANAVPVPDISTVAPYAAFGAFYFLVSAIWLTVSSMRKPKRAAA